MDADTTPSVARASDERPVRGSPATLVVAAGALVVAVSVFHQWLHASRGFPVAPTHPGATGLYEFRAVLTVPAVVALGLALAPRYGRQAAVLASFTGVATAVAPPFFLLAANRISDGYSWHPQLAFYTTIFGGMVLLAGGWATAAQSRPSPTDTTVRRRA